MNANFNECKGQFSYTLPLSLSHRFVLLLSVLSLHAFSCASFGLIPKHTLVACFQRVKIRGQSLHAQKNVGKSGTDVPEALSGGGSHKAWTERCDLIFSQRS